MASLSSIDNSLIHQSMGEKLNPVISIFHNHMEYGYIMNYEENVVYGFLWSSCGNWTSVQAGQIT